MRRIGERGRALAYAVYGSGPPLLLLHGFTGTHRLFCHLLPGLGHRRLLLPDLLGHGASDAPRAPAHHALEAQARTLLALLEREGYAVTDVVGYSLGGRLALRLATLSPDRIRRLVLVSTSPGIEGEEARSARRAADERLARLLEEEGLGAFLEHWQSLPLFAALRNLPEALRALLWAERRAQRAEGLAASLRGAGQGVEPSLWPSLAQLSMPVLLLTGDQDTAYREVARRAARLIPKARWHEIRGAGHAAYLEAPAAFQEAIRAFLDEP